MLLIVTSYFVQLSLQVYTLALLTVAMTENSHSVGFFFVIQFRMRDIIYFPRRESCSFFRYIVELITATNRRELLTYAAALVLF